MSIHQSKGLEFDVVFLPALEDGIFPNAKTLLERGGMESERRLFYVAITRAKKILYISSAKRRFKWGEYKQTSESIFIIDSRDKIERIY
jgi:DNA helicase-2/ATP-dependent DNA helicase PcrA